jgi:hypothetical protein
MTFSLGDTLTLPPQTSDRWLVIAIDRDERLDEGVVVVDE